MSTVLSRIWSKVSFLFPIYYIEVKQWFFIWDNTKTSIAIFPFVFMLDTSNERGRYHSKVHIIQQLKGLLIFFLIRYVYYHYKYGYWNNPYENEARDLTAAKFKNKKA